MNLRQLSKHLDKQALRFARQGEINKTFAAMGLAAFIRRQPKSFQSTKFSLDMLDNNK
jgi:hypothetical protein